MKKINLEWSEWWYLGNPELRAAYHRQKEDANVVKVAQQIQQMPKTKPRKRRRVRKKSVRRKNRLF